jgi:hypothetical protein
MWSRGLPGAPSNIQMMRHRLQVQYPQRLTKARGRRGGVEDRTDLPEP